MSYNSSRNSRPTYGRKPRGNYQKSRSRGPKKDYIHPSRFVQKAKPITMDVYEPVNMFHDFELHPIIQTNLVEKGYTEPSPIQDQTIPIGLAGKDVVGIANTGTGKTAAFAIPILHNLMTNKDGYALILAPTRELAQQIEEQCKSIAKNSGLNGAILIGGVSMGPQLRDLRSNPRIVIGTPGRVKDHAQQGTLQLSKFNIVVLDEVDRMLDMGFINDITDILRVTSLQKQSFFFSATLDPKVKTIIESFASQPEHIMVKTGDTSDNVEQDIIPYKHKSEKMDKLHDILLDSSVSKTLVFDDTHRSVESLAKELQLRGFKSDAIHGGKSQAARQKALSRFKNSQVDVLVATDVAARGIDVSDITHVVNFSTPQSYEDYVHRIGRAGRAGKPGFALTFVEG